MIAKVTGKTQFEALNESSNGKSWIKTKTPAWISAFILALALIDKSEAQTLNIAYAPAVVISFQGLPYTDYTVQTSTNLGNTNLWQSAGTVPGNATGAYVYYSPNPNLSQQLYRVVADYGTNETYATVTLDPETPVPGPDVVTTSVQGQYLGLPVLVFDVTAHGNKVHLRNVVVDFSSLGSDLITNAYLYQGSTLVDSVPVASLVTNDVAIFNNIADGQAGATIASGASLPYTVKVDIAGLVGTNTEEIIGASVIAPNLAIYDPTDTAVGVGGAAFGNSIDFFSTGPVFSLKNAPTAETVTSGSGGSLTSIITATFNVNVTAVGEPVNLALPSSPFAAFGQSSTTTNNVQIFLNGSALPGNGGYQVYCEFSQPTNTTYTAPYFTIAQNQTVTVPITYIWSFPENSSDQYSIELTHVNWSTTNGMQYTTIIPFSQAWMTPALF
jgi:hypothetical protein